MVDRSNIYNKLDFKTVASTWFNAFFQILTENCQKEELPARLQELAVISFNYDRCFEHYMYLALQNYYGMSAEETVRMLALLEVHHPYGKVGSLPWMASSEAIEYGANPTPRQLIAISKLLRRSLRVPIPRRATSSRSELLSPAPSGCFFSDLRFIA